MRANNRSRILDAAVRVVQRVGASRLTLEAAAEEAGVTRGGMTYHFRDRAALSLALQEHLAAGWEEQLVLAAGKSATDASAAEKAIAYAHVAMDSASNGELELILESAHDAVLNEPWRRVQRRWAPSVEEAIADRAAMQRLILCLAADGLWAYESLSGQKLAVGVRHTIAQQIALLVDETASPGSG